MDARDVFFDTFSPITHKTTPVAMKWLFIHMNGGNVSFELVFANKALITNGTGVRPGLAGKSLDDRMDRSIGDGEGSWVGFSLKFTGGG